MTEVDEIVIKNFESKLIRLMEAHTALAHENMQLRERLAHQSVELDEAREQYAILQKSYSDLKLAKIISVDDTEIGNTQKKLSKLVREVARIFCVYVCSPERLIQSVVLLFY